MRVVGFFDAVSNRMLMNTLELSGVCNKVGPVCAWVLFSCLVGGHDPFGVVLRAPHIFGGEVVSCNVGEE